MWAYAQEKMADTISNFPLPALFGTQTPTQFSSDKSPAKKEPPLTVALLKNTLYLASEKKKKKKQKHPHVAPQICENSSKIR